MRAVVSSEGDVALSHAHGMVRKPMIAFCDQMVSSLHHSKVVEQVNRSFDRRWVVWEQPRPDPPLSKVSFVLISAARAPTCSMTMHCVLLEMTDVLLLYRRKHSALDGCRHAILGQMTHEVILRAVVGCHRTGR